MAVMVKWPGHGNSLPSQHFERLPNGRGHHHDFRALPTDYIAKHPTSFRCLKTRRSVMCCVSTCSKSIRWLLNLFENHSVEFQNAGQASGGISIFELQAIKRLHSAYLTLPTPFGCYAKRSKSIIWHFQDNQAAFQTSDL